MGVSETEAVEKSVGGERQPKQKENDGDAGNKGYPESRAQSVFGSLLRGNAVTNDRISKLKVSEQCDFDSVEAFVHQMTIPRPTKDPRDETTGQTVVNVEIFSRDYVPAYVTRVATKTEVLSKEFAVNAYHRKNELPQLPRTDEQSTARFDGAWGLDGNNSRATAPVHGFVKLNGAWFMLLRNAKLPDSADGSSVSWPLAGGMYPTHLNNEAHQHRSKWTGFHGMSAPRALESDVAAQAAAEAWQPLVGSALVGFPSFKFIVNGKEVTVRNA